MALVTDDSKLAAHLKSPLLSLLLMVVAAFLVVACDNEHGRGTKPTPSSLYINPPLTPPPEGIACFNQEFAILNEADAPVTSAGAEQTVEAYVEEQRSRAPEFPFPGELVDSSYIRTKVGGSVGSIDGTPVTQEPHDETGWLLVFEPGPPAPDLTPSGIVSEIAFIVFDDLYGQVDHCAGQRFAD